MSHYTEPLRKSTGVTLSHLAWGIAEVKCIVVMAVCVSVYLSLETLLHHCMDTAVTWANGRRCPLVVHYWADLQSLHGFRCFDNIHVCKLIALYTTNAYSANCVISASACTCSMYGYHCAYEYHKIYYLCSSKHAVPSAFCKHRAINNTAIYNRCVEKLNKLNTFNF